MPMVRVTSRIDLLVRLVLVVGVLCLGATLIDAYQPIIVRDSSLGVKDAELVAFAIVFVGCLMVLVVIPGDADEHMAALSSFFYVLFTHHVFLTWAEARSVSNLFANNAYDTWYPLSEVKALPRPERKAAIVAVAQRTDRYLPPEGAHVLLGTAFRKGLLLALFSVVWLLVVAYVFVVRTSALAAMLSIGVVPLLVLWVFYFVLHGLSYVLRRSSHG